MLLHPAHFQFHCDFPNSSLSGVGDGSVTAQLLPSTLAKWGLQTVIGSFPCATALDCSVLNVEAVCQARKAVYCDGRETVNSTLTCYVKKSTRLYKVREISAPETSVQPQCKDAGGKITDFPFNRCVGPFIAPAKILNFVNMSSENDICMQAVKLL